MDIRNKFKKRGDVFFIDKYPTVGTEQTPGRPFIVVSPNEMLHKGSGALCVPLTTKEKRPLPQHFEVDCLGKKSTALCEQLRYIDESYFGDYYCSLDELEMEALNRALKAAVGIDFSVADSTTDESQECLDAKSKIKKLEDVLKDKDEKISSLTEELAERDETIKNLKTENDKLLIKIEAYKEIIKS